MSYARGKSKFMFFPLLLIVFTIFFLSGCSSDESTQGNLELGDESALKSDVIGSGGGEIFISPEDADFPGIKLTVPEGAFLMDTPVNVSYKPIEKNGFGEMFTPLTPLIHIDIGEQYAQKTLLLEIPVTIPDDMFAMAFYYDPETGEFEGIPSVWQDDKYFLVQTKHFSDILIGGIAYDLLFGNIESRFEIGRDSWQFANVETYGAPNGICQGMNQTALYYYQILKKKGGALYGIYDNDGEVPQTPTFWQDDTAVLKLSSMAQGQALSEDYYEWMDRARNNSPLWNFYMLSYSMLLTKEPQYIAVMTTNDWSARDISGHSLIAYKKEGNKLFVYNPNEPLNKDTYIEFNLENEKMIPYSASATSTSSQLFYEAMYYVGTSAILDYEALTDLWKKTNDGTIGMGTFPAYELMVMTTDAQGNTVYVPLVDGYKTTESKLKIKVVSSSFQGRIKIYTENQSLSAAGENDGTIEYSINDGDNTLGFLVEAPMGNMYSGEKMYVWTGFDWLTIKKAELEKWSGTLTIIEVYEASGLTEAQRAEVMNQTLSVNYLMEKKEDGSFNVYNPNTGQNFVLKRDNNTLTGELRTTAGDQTLIDIFDGYVNETDDIISGNSTVYLGDGRISYVYHVELMRD